MSYFQFEQEQFLKGDLPKVWEFISNPKNLAKITPEYMGFEIKTKPQHKMYQGMLIGYVVRPILGLKLNWLTEITVIKDQEFFIDEQRIGPYKLWHHQHKIKEVEGGVVMNDIITYALPFGFFNGIINRLLVRQKLHDIFAFRKDVLEKYFGGQYVMGK